MSRPLQLAATAAMGVEAVVARELETLGYEATVVGGQIRFRGTEADIPRANLWLRSADRVHVVVGELNATSFPELFDGIRAMPWGELLPRDAAFPVQGKSIKSTLHSVPAVQRVTKKAIVEALKEAHGIRDWLPEDGPRFKVTVAMRKDVATLTFDSSGEALHKRGYRVAAGAAPLKETLAAALLQLTFWRADRPLADPFCGSGTLPIEAALLGRDMAPGVGRAFDAQSWPWVDQGAWERAYAEVDERAAPERPLDIVGSDLDPSAIDDALANAGRAGLGPTRGGKRGQVEGLRFKQMDARDLQPWADFGVIVTNPPYGERAGEARQVTALMAELGPRWRAWETWSAFVLSGLPGFEEAFGAKAQRRRKLYNGPIRAYYYQYPSNVRPRDRDGE